MSEAGLGSQRFGSPISGQAESVLTEPPSRRPWVLANLLGCAGVVHLAMAPVHFELSAGDGLAFVALGWAQLGLMLLVISRDRRWLSPLIAAVSLAAVAGWVVSRTIGLPVGSHAGAVEKAGFIDSATVAMEVATLVVLGLTFLGAKPERLRARPASPTNGLCGGGDRSGTSGYLSCLGIAFGSRARNGWT